MFPSFKHYNGKKEEIIEEKIVIKEKVEGKWHQMFVRQRYMKVIVILDGFHILEAGELVSIFVALGS